MLRECLIIFIGAACFGAIVALLIRPLNFVRVGRGFVQCGLGGAYFALAWWLAPITPQNWLFRYLLDGVVGFIGLSSIIFLVIALVGLRDNKSL